MRACRRRAAMTRLYTMLMRQGVSRATLLRFRQHGLDTTAAPTRPLPAAQQCRDLRDRGQHFMFGVPAS